MTGIEWTEATWNPIVGCSIVSPGCTNCYGMEIAADIELMTQIEDFKGLTREMDGNVVWTGKVRLSPEETLLAPLRGRTPTMWSVNNMSDLFHESVPDEWIDRVFAVMALCPEDRFQVLTKRSARMRKYLDGAAGRVADAIQSMRTDDNRVVVPLPHVRPGAQWWPLPNVWLGVSCERQQEADERIPDLLATPAAVRFVSAEPLLGPVDFRGIWNHCPTHDFPGGFCIGPCPDRRRLDWVICGGESGPGARPMHPDWARSIRDQCAAAGVPYFFKQWGEWISVDQIDDDQCRALYVSNRAAKDGESQDALDECYGQTCKVRTLCLRIDGNHCEPDSPNAFLAGTRPILGFKVGKSSAGRLLDGREHSEWPRTEMRHD